MVEEVLGLTPGEGALGGRLVDPAAARAVAALRRARRRGAGRAARRAGRPARRAGQARLGRAGVRRDRWPRRRPRPRVDPWRRTSGMHRVRKRRQLAVVRALWERRDEIARRRDIAPGRVLPDAAIVEPRPWPARAPRPTWSRCRSGAAGRCAGRPRPGCPAIERGAGRSPTTTCPSSRRCHDGPPPARSLGATGTRPRPPGWPPPGPPSRALAGEHGHAGREPARPGHGPPAVLGSAGRRSRPTSGRRCCGPTAPGRGRSG